MNRWLVALLITLAVIVLVSPGIVGRLAEKSVEESLNFAASESDDLVVTTESFERGWFASEGRHRIELRQGAVQTMFENIPVEHDGAPYLIIDTHIDHGLVPVTSMSRDSGSLKPGLASMVSAVKLDPGSGKLFDIPGKIYSDVGLTGETVSRFLLEAGTENLDGIKAEWQGADVTVHTNPASGSMAVRGGVLPWAVLAEGVAVKFGGVTIDAVQEKSEYGLSFGSIQLEVDSVDIQDDNRMAGGFSKLSLAASSEIVGETMNAASRVDISDIKTPDFGDVDLTMDIILNGLDAASTYKVSQALRNAQTSTHPQDALAAVYPTIEADVRKLLATGLEIRLDQLDITLPSGKVATKLRFSLAASDPAAQFSWPAVLLALDASVYIRLPVELFDMVETMSPEAGTLVAMGVFIKDGDFYEMQAEYAKGLLTVNGAPLPIPLQGF